VMVLGGAIGEACDTETRELARIHAQVRAQSEEQSGRVTEIAGHLTGRRVVDIDVGGAFATLASFRVVDVRSYEEFVGELGHIDGARLETLADDVARRLGDLPRDTPLLFVCRKGGRSARAARLALDAGFSDIHNLLGGMEAWNDARLPVVLSGRAAPSTR
ncbi:MAG: rhodanese-like domain-containing protein, partial [Myxococcales bacterium]|nr:rhodanese-like domain-containing protein [Myxococcales bacterium]